MRIHWCVHITYSSPLWIILQYVNTNSWQQATTNTLVSLKTPHILFSSSDAECPRPCGEILSHRFFRAQWLKMESTRTGYKSMATLDKSHASSYWLLTWTSSLVCGNGLCHEEDDVASATARGIWYADNSPRVLLLKCTTYLIRVYILNTRSITTFVVTHQGEIPQHTYNCHHMSHSTL